MASAPKIFAKLCMLATLVLLVNADNHPTRLDNFEEKLHEKEIINSADYRLPKSIIPINYDIKLTSIDFGNFIFNGTCTITVQVKESVDEILLNAGSITVNVNSIVEGDEKIVVGKITKNDTTEIFKISLKKKLTINSTIYITLSYGGKLRDDMIGFYRSSYFNDKGEQRWLAATQFESTHARHAFPCFDEPQFKAQFDISIRVPDSSYNCLSNMEYTFNSTTNWCIFKKTQKMSTYLVAFVISDFVPNSENKAPLKLWARPNAKSQAVYGQEIGTKIIKKFGEIFGQDYYDETTKKMDMVAVPDFSAGAMENWGLITYREATGLYDKDHSTDANQQYVASVIVHECAHMWFGNLVTPDWWNNLWLSEAFARYYQYMGTDMITDNWKMAEQFIVEQFHTAMGVDSVEDSKPMTRPEGDLITPEQISSAGGTITYNKGASIVRMMEKIFGEDIFYASLRSYLSDRKLQSANPDHLWEAFQKYVDPAVNVSTLMKTWTEHAGYPYITVEVEPKSIKLKQDRFLLRHSNNLPQHLWSVPITFSSSNSVSESTKPEYWLSKQEDEITRDNQKDDWLILNVQSAGFYRVNYDKKSWERIINLLTKGDYKKLHVTNRAAIVDDLLNLARAEIIDYKLAFRGIQYLRREKDYLPFYSALKGLDYLTRVTAESSDYDFLKNYTTSLIEDVYRDLTFDDKKDDDRLTTLLRRELNGRVCGFDDASCVDKSLKYFKDWKTNNKNLVPKNQRSVVYCTAIRHGTSDDWDFLYKQYKKANVAAEQTTILSALGCSQDNVVLEKYLLKALSGFEKSLIRAQDVSSVFNGVYTASLKNAIFMIDFADKNHKALHDYHKKYDAIGSLITGALQRYPIKKLVDKVEKIIATNATHITSNVASIKKSLTSAKQEIDLFKKCLPPAIDSLKETDPSIENTTAYRLPANIIPSHYQLYLAPHISPEENFTFDGEVKITANVTRTLDKITLHTDQLNILSIKISNINDKEKPIELKHLAHTRREKYHFTDIPMENFILEGTKISIEIKYTGTLNTEMRGFYRSSYKTKSETRWLAATQLEPTAARRVFPSFDEPALKAVFSISVQTEKSFRVLSNTKHTSNDKDLWVFEDTPRMSTYLIAVVVSDFSDLSTEDAKHEYHVWSSNLVVGQGAYALEVMGPITRWFEDKLGHDFSMKKLAQVALPDFTSGAMENWGLLTYRETNLLYDPKKMSSLSNKQSIRNVIAHEITHQWFGDLVSPLWWNYTWLNEGFARYFQCHAYTQNETDWNLETQFVVDHLQTSFSKDGSTSTHAITTEVYSPTQIKAIFDSISYAKAASIIRMLEKLTGSKIFYAALNKYLDECKFDAGTPEHLFKAFQNEVDSDKTIKNLNVTRLMNSWTLQKGFPILNIEFKDDETATIKQSRFYQRVKKEDSTMWEVPLTWATKSDPNFNNTRDVTWIRNKHNFVTIKREKDDWVVFNVQQMGYFRVNYDEKMWNLIIKALNSSEYTQIHEINRANIIDDLLHLGQLGQVPYSLVFSGLSYLAHETEYAPWKAAFTGLNYLNRRFDGRPEIYNSYKEFIIRLLEPTFKRLKFDDQENDRTRDILLRHQVLNWLCEFDHEECVKEALIQFEKEKNSTDEKDAVVPNKRPYVYCTAIKKGDEKDWEYLWKKLVDSVYATERVSLLGALACSENPALLKRLMDETIKVNSEVRLQDSKTVFSNIVNSGLVGVATALDFISTNYELMNKRLGDESISKSTLDTIAKRVSTKQLLKKFEEVVKNCEKTMPGICSSLQSSLNRANDEMKWFTEKTPKIFEWLQSDNIKKQISHVKNDDYRLPNTAKPEVYEIFMTPYFEEKNFTFEAEVIIDIKINEPTYSIVLHQHALNIKSIVAESGDKEYEITNKLYNNVTQQLTIFFKDSFDSETTFKLKIQYDGVLRDDMRGFYRSSYIDEHNKTKWLASTHFEPTYARRAFPCMDEPSFKARFTLHLSTPKGYHALSNMGSNPAQRPDGERTWNDFETSLKMSPYLLAFVVSEYEKTSDPQSKRVAAWSRPQLKPYMKYAPPTGEASLKFLENFSKIKYPLAESNLISIPDFDMGAMENWGLVTFREYGLTYSEQLTSASYKRYVNTVISHELVHQWFGNLVTCAWWDYTWLNEGFADYVSYLISDTIEPKWKLMKQFVIKELHVGLESDSANSSHPMNNKVFTPDEAQDGFDRIAYQKSGSVLRMLHNSFGDKVFTEAIQAYLKAKSYDVARPEDLYKAMEERMSKETKKPGDLKVDVTTVMKSWTEQAGYPVVHATRVKDKVTLTQTRFLSSSTSESKKNETYWVPITYTSEAKPDFESLTPKLWLNDKPAIIPLAEKEKWFILNVQQVGFYRVNYDSDNWQALTGLLNSENFTTIHEVNRAQLIDDLFNLARGEKYGIDYGHALDASLYLERETNYLPWSAYFTATTYLNQRLEGNQRMKKLYIQHVLAIIEKVYKKLGFTENVAKDDHLDQLNRELITTWACKYGHKDCVDKAKKFISNSNQTITANIATAVYCTAVEHGDSKVWDDIWDRYTNALLATDYLTILRGLGCSKDAKVLEKYLERIIEPASKVRRQDAGTAFASIYTSSQVGLDTALQFFANNLVKLQEFYGNWHEVGSLLSGMAGRISNDEQIGIIEKLKNNTEAKNIESSIDSSIKAAKKNLDWFKTNSNFIQKWLGSRYKEETTTNKPGSAYSQGAFALLIIMIQVVIFMF